MLVLKTIKIRFFDQVFTFSFMVLAQFTELNSYISVCRKQFKISKMCRMLYTGSFINIFEQFNFNQAFMSKTLQIVSTAPDIAIFSVC
jgi:hypothetical protein